MLIVPDGEEVAVRRREPLQDLVLDWVQVLEFVHQEVVPARRDDVRDLGLAPEQLARARDQVVEVEQVALGEVSLVIPELLLLRRRQAIVLEAPPSEQRQQPSALLLAPASHTEPA